MEISITVNQKKVKAEKGELLLDVLERQGIHVPTLCHMKDFLPSGACRMCVVENEQTGRLITACSFTAEPGMEIKTHSGRVIEARKTIVELLLSNHPDDCLYCVRNGNCDLQDLAREHHITERRISGEKNTHHTDLSSASIVRAPSKCILCGRCVKVCEEVMGVSAIDFINRGSKTIIGPTFKKGLNTSSCVNCGQCIMVCPTGALSEKNHFAEIMEALKDPKKTVVVQYAPAISVTIAEEFGMEPGTDVNGLLNAALRKTGFDKIFDTTFAADLTIMEESAELIQRISNGGTLPMITSCCPGWIKYAEEFAGDFLPNISTCKSPQQMLGAVLKSYYAGITGISPENLYVVSIMPCSAKKFEGQREEMTQKGISDIDAVLTTRELVDFFHLFGIAIDRLETETADSPHGIRSSAGKLFGVSGGVMEAALRTAYFKLTNKELPHFKINDVRGLAGRKETYININGFELGVAVVNGLANAKILLDEIRGGRRDIHFIEIMACPAGCIGGGGQPLGKDPQALIQRMKALYRIDETESIKVSHKNPEVLELYQVFLEKPLSKKSHEILHTTYSKRDVLL
jgi:iron-only hydrogenase group A